MLTAFVAAGLALTRFGQRGKSADLTDDDRYGYSLVGLGYTLLVVGALNIIAFSGFVAAGYIDRILPSGTMKTDGDPNAAFVMVRLMDALGMALLGALFFVTNSMRRKRDRREPYNTSKFWGGLWYRLGEAVLFTVVFFLGLRYYASSNEDLLPIVALFLGMFVTSGETLVFGLAQRVLRAATALVGPPEQTVAKSTAGELEELAKLKGKGELSADE